jgi:SPP1 gp7 family putative phage head morphogenesis protein
MTFAVTADPDRFDEAADWFSKRIVLTQTEALELGADAGRRAFWIGGGLQLSQIQRVFDQIQKAEATGEPFEEWRKRVKSELRDDAHAETVFRNAVQRSYNAGRWAQMTEPSVVQFRPYWMYDAVLDSRTTEICKVCNKVVLPAEHPWFYSHWPPQHHRCRAGVRNLRRSEAEKRGISNVPPALDASSGFGRAPVDDQVWKPDRTKHDPVLIRELDAKENKAPAKKPRPKKAHPHHSPEYWEDRYRSLGEGVKARSYGEASPAIGWGRAMLERGLDRSPTDLLSELERLQEEGHPAVANLSFTWLRDLPPNRPIRKAILTANQRALIALQEHTRTITVGEFEIDSDLLAVESASSFYRMMLDKRVVRPNPVVRLDTSKRAHFLARGALQPDGKHRDLVVLDDDVGDSTAVHELAHAIEEVDTRALQRSLAFLRARTAGERAQHMTELQPGRDYRDDEMARPDEFFNQYVGMDYGDRATEITSMGYERLLEGWKLGALSDKDPDMLFFLLGQLAGR